MNTPKRRILSLVFTVLCFKKSLLITIIMIIIIVKNTKERTCHFSDMDNSVFPSNGNDFTVVGAR